MLQFTYGISPETPVKRIFTKFDLGIYPGRHINQRGFDYVRDWISPFPTEKRVRRQHDAA